MIDRLVRVAFVMADSIEKNISQIQNQKPRPSALVVQQEEAELFEKYAEDLAYMGMGKTDSLEQAAELSKIRFNRSSTVWIRLGINSATYSTIVLTVFAFLVAKNEILVIPGLFLSVIMFLVADQFDKMQRRFTIAESLLKAGAKSNAQLHNPGIDDDSQKIIDKYYKTMLTYFVIGLAVTCLIALLIYGYKQTYILNS